MNLVLPWFLFILRIQYIGGKFFSLVLIFNSNFFEYSTVVFDSFIFIYLWSCVSLIVFSYNAVFYLYVVALANYCCATFSIRNRANLLWIFLRYSMTSSCCYIKLVFSGFTHCFILLILFLTCNMISFFVTSFSCLLLLEDNSLGLQSTNFFARTPLHLFQWMVLVSRKLGPYQPSRMFLFNKAMFSNYNITKVFIH